MRAQRILLTGGSGMVGRNLLEHPKASEFEVLAPSRRELDLLNFSAVQDYLKRCDPDLIIHAAGKVGGIQANMRDPVSFLLQNLDMGRNIVWGARLQGIKYLINLGSSCMYPKNYMTPMDEDLLLTGELESTNEGYALAKIVTSRLCEYITQLNQGYLYKTLIPCNLFGRHDSFDPEDSHLIPAIIHKIHLAKKRGDAVVTIWGDGSARREFMYAGDLADAIWRSVDTFESLPYRMNVGLGEDYTISEYYKVVAEVIGYQGGFVFDLDKPVGMRRKLISVERQMNWGWRVNSDLTNNIYKTYQFYLQEYCQ